MTSNRNIFEPTLSRPLPDEIAGHLLSAIREGTYKVGMKLPSERKLCEKYNVSRAVIREALSQLKSEGFAKSRAGSGVFIIEPDNTEAFRIQAVSLNEKKSLSMVMELLITIESAAARLAASRRTEVDLKIIKKALVRMEFEIVNDRLGDEQDFIFHQAITNATHNPHYQALNRHLEHSVRRFIRRARSNTKVTHTSLIEDVQKEHHAIYDAIKYQDLPGAAYAATMHLENAAKRMQIYLEE